MRLAVRDIDDLFVAPADLSDLAFEGSPEAVTVVTRHRRREVLPDREASLDRPTGSHGDDERFDLARALRPPQDAVVRWSHGIAFLHVVSYHYCTIDDVLDHGHEQRKSPRALGRTGEDAFRARNVAEAMCDDLCRRTFRATYKVDDGAAADGRVHQLAWPASRVITRGWQAFGDGLCGQESGSLPCARRGTRADLEYVSGTDAGVPPDVRAAVAKLAASFLMATKVPDRAVYESTEQGTTRFTLADAGSTGIPDVDAVFSRHARARLAVL